ncbi:MAG: AI-2E family transporter [Desulfosalsimonadaceae bacterium]
MQAQQGREIPQAAVFLITGACFVVIVAGMKAAADILVPFFLAIFIAIIFTPALFWLQRRKVPTIVAILLIIAFMLAVGYLLTRFVGSSINEFTNDLPRYRAMLVAKSAYAQQWLNNMGIELTDQMVRKHLNPATAMQMAGKTLTALGGVLTNAFLILLTVIFILLEAAGFPDKIRAALKAPEKSLANFSQFTESVNRYLALKTLLSLVTGLLVWLWLAALGVDYALLWGLFAFILNYVPNIGSIIAAVPAVLLALVQLGPLHTALTAAGYLVINAAIGNLVEPRLQGGRLGLSTLVVFLSLVFWGWVLGPVGMLLSVPLTMIVKIGLASNEETRWLAVILGKDAAEAEHLNREDT